MFRSAYVPSSSIYDPSIHPRRRLKLADCFMCVAAPVRTEQTTVYRPPRLTTGHLGAPARGLSRLRRLAHVLAGDFLQSHRTKTLPVLLYKKAGITTHQNGRIRPCKYSEAEARARKAEIKEATCRSPTSLWWFSCASSSPAAPRQALAPRPCRELC